ncbi:MAG TPA: amino acid racemase [Candidatus Atribacteria bacterium]|nr:amino acid racemase [Candidatus Atribacteria bacterium]HPT78628.1 amino acid racemase [Candidatus Atribacteria bacterium]
MNDRVIGIIGGMGPEATASLFMKIIKATRAEKDQDHFRIIIDNNPKIPDRTAAILGKGTSPVPAIVEAGRNLEKMGAEIALIPCNTSHYFLDEIQSRLKIPVMNMIAELAAYIGRAYPHVTKAGLLATTGTIKTGLYQKYMPGLQLICPDPASQENKVMKAIYGERGIKAGNTGEEPMRLLADAANELITAGAEVVIAGCTEICLALKPEHISRPLLDPMDVMAQAVVERLSKKPSGV